MRIFIDIGHPAHVHYFKNFIWQMKDKGHEFIIIAREKEFSHQLLDAYNFEYVGRGRGRDGIVGKFLYILKADLLILKLARKFKPDIFVSFCTPYLSHAAFLLSKPCIVIDDTDHAKLNHSLYVPFATSILTPKFFLRDFREKQIRFDAYFESIYLHPKYYKNDHTDQKTIPTRKKDNYVIVRFVSWKANHDMYGRNKGLTTTNKINLIKLIQKKCSVYITSEVKLPEELEEYRLMAPPQMIHSILANACLFIGESLTMASEAALLGTPSICFSTATAGTLENQISRGLIKSFTDYNKLIPEISKILNDKNYKKNFKIKSEEYFRESINFTDFLVWFVENYPKSSAKMKEQPDYQYNFR
jgi:uncharacterized protein